MKRFAFCLVALCLWPLAAFGQLTPAQLATFKAHMEANTNQINGTAINAMAHTPDNAFAIAAWYSQDAAGPYKAWNTRTPLKALRAAVDLSRYTPTDNPPASTNTVTGTNDALLFNNRALKCQLQQANAVFLLQGEGEVDATGQQFRQSFGDCMVGIPSGAGGAAQNAGWGTAGSPGAVRLAMQRPATNIEKVFSVQAAGAGAAGNVAADPRGGGTNPDALVYVGGVTAAQVQAAWELP